MDKGLALPRSASRSTRTNFKAAQLSGGWVMSKMIFVNLPVRDLAKAKAFYEAMGAVNNPQFSDATSACMVVSDTIFVMLLTHEKWAFFTKKPIADARNASEAMLAI